MKLEELAPSQHTSFNAFFLAMAHFRAEAAELLGIPQPANEKNVTSKEERSSESE